MYQSVLTNHTLTKEEVINAYNKKLISIGNQVLGVQRFNLSNKIDRYTFIKLKNLLPLVTADIVTTPYNTLFSALKN